MKPDDLWNDTLDEALSPRFTASCLAAMQREGRRRQQRRQWISTSAAALFLLLSVIWFSHTPSTAPVAITTAQPAAPAAPPAPVQYLSDGELLARLQEAGIGVAVAGSGDDKRLLLVSQKGGVYQP